MSHAKHNLSKQSPARNTASAVLSSGARTHAHQRRFDHASAQAAPGAAEAALTVEPRLPVRATADVGEAERSWPCVSFIAEGV
eukprot:5905382-Pleurochrysis_carterae.AAC.1